MLFAADVGAGASGRGPGVVAGILPAVMSPGRGRRGLRSVASVTPEWRGVRPITGGSPFLTNSHWPEVDESVWKFPLMERVLVLGGEWQAM